MEELCIDGDLPKDLRNHGAELFMIDSGDKIKFVIVNTRLRYRKFIYVTKRNEESTFSLNDLITAYMAEFNLRIAAK